MPQYWTALLPPVLTIAVAAFSRRIIPSLVLGLFAGGLIFQPTAIGWLDAPVDAILKTLTDRNNLQVLLFLYFFSALMRLLRRAGGIEALTARLKKFVHSERGVFYTIWAMLPLNFIDCGFRVIAAGAVVSTLAKEKKVSPERIAMTLNNTATPFVELIPFATTFVGFNVANITLGLANAGLADRYSAYPTLLRAIPYEFFSLSVLVATFVAIYIFPRRSIDSEAKGSDKMDARMEDMEMDDSNEKPEIAPRLINLFIPLLGTVSLSLFFFWYFGQDPKFPDRGWFQTILNTDPNRAMLVALGFSLVGTIVLFFSQKYRIKKMTADIIAGGNSLMRTLIILVLAWSLGHLTESLHLSEFIRSAVGGTLPGWSIPLCLFLLSSAITYFIGAGWAAASIIMPFALTLALAGGAAIPISVAAVITGGTFGDVTSPVAGMTNMASSIAGAKHSAYLKFMLPFNLTALFVASILFLVFGWTTATR